MNKLITLGLIALSMNTAFAADGTYASNLDMTRIEGNQVKVERVESEPVLEGRNDANNGGIKFHKSVDQDQTIQLTGRRD